MAMERVLPFKITVCGFEELTRRGEAAVSHVLSIVDPGLPVPDEFGSVTERRRLELRFHDVIEDMPRCQPPALEHVNRLLALGRDLAAARLADLHLLIHCHAGVSRSPAALTLLIAQARPSLGALPLASVVLRIRPCAWPNLRIIELGDRILNRRGELVDAASEIYRRRLERRPELAGLLVASGRVREVEAGRRRQRRPPRNPDQMAIPFSFATAGIAKRHDQPATVIGAGQRLWHRWRARLNRV
jgi:predicted protein tyrosine phosphatase